MRMPLPLRIAVPLALVALGLSIIVVSILHDRHASFRALEEQTLQRAQTLNYVALPALEKALARLDVSGTEGEIARLGVTPNMIVAFLCDPYNRVVHCTDYTLCGQPLQATALASALPLIDRARTTLLVQSEIASDRTAVRVASPVHLSPLPGEYHPSHIAVLYTQMDLALQRQEVLADIMQRAVLAAAIVFAVSLMAWFFLRVTFMRHLESLTQAVSAFDQDGGALRVPNIHISELATTARVLNDLYSRLLESERRHRLVMQGTGAAWWDWDLTTKRVWYSTQWAALRGLSEAELTSREEEWSQRIHPDDRPRVMAALEAHFAGKSALFAEEYQVMHKDGNWRWVVDRGMAQWDDHGTVVRMTGYELDITDSKRAEEALRFRDRAMETALSAVAMADMQGRISYVNTPFLRLWGYSSASEVLGRTALDFWESGEAVRPVLECLLSGKSWEGDLRGRKSSGEVFEVRAQGNCILGVNEQVIGITGAFMDVTEMRDRQRTQAFLLRCGMPETGEDFFNMLAKHLSATLNMEYVCIDQLEGDLLNAETLAVYHDGSFESNVRYTLKDTPCGAVVDRGVCCYLRGVCREFPRDAALQDLRAESYLGITLFSAAGRPIGLIAVIGRMPLQNPKRAKQILELVAPRAAGELERRIVERARCQSEELLQMAQAAANAGSWEWNLLTNTNIWSESLWQLYGLKRDGRQASYDLWREAILPEDRATTEKTVLETVERGSNLYVEWRVGGPGMERWLMSCGQPQRAPDGKVTRYLGVVIDITERKRIEAARDHAAQALREAHAELEAQVAARTSELQQEAAALHRSEENFRAFFDLIPMFAFVLDKEGVILHANNVSLRRLGYTQQELAGRSVLQIHPAEQSRAVKRAVSEMIAGRTESCGVPILAKDGSLIPVETRVSQGMWNGKPVLFGTSKDITALQESEARHRDMFTHHSAVMLLVHTETGAIVDANRSAEKYYGYPHAKLCSMRIQDINLLNEKQQVERRRRAARSEVQRFIFQHRLANGQVRWVEVFSTPIRAKGEDLLFSIIHDITDRKQTEETLKTLSNAVESTPLPVVITDPKGFIQYTNPWFTKETGYAPAEVVGKTLRILKSGKHPAEFYAAMWRALREGNIWRGEVCNRKKDGSLYWESLVISTVRNAEGVITHHVGIWENITERRRLADELLKAKEEADEASRMKSAFLANVSHEIRTPMNAILGNANLLQQDRRLGRQAMSKLEIINRSGCHLLELINNVLEISKVEAGCISLTSVDFDLWAMLDEVGSLFRNQPGKTAVALIVKKSAELPRRLIGDQRKLRQILLNLMDNALKFTTQGQIVLSSSGRPLSNGMFRLEVEVQDSGEGIAPNEIVRLFRPFEQSSSGRKLQIGTGLGLAISREYARLMGGDLSAESAPGRGSVFRLRVPLRVQALKKPQANVRQKDEVRRAHRKRVRRILVVDDLADNRGWLRESLEAAGFAVREATDGEEGIKAWQEWSPDVVMMDLRMPKVDGAQATRRIRELDQPRKTWIFILTAAIMEVDRAALVEAGADEILAKPIVVNALVELICARLRLRSKSDRSPRHDPQGKAPRKQGHPPPDGKKIPADLRTAILRALHEGDTRALVRLSTLLKKKAPALGAALKERVENYDYNGIARLLAPKEKG